MGVSQGRVCRGVEGVAAAVGGTKHNRIRYVVCDVRT